MKVIPIENTGLSLTQAAALCKQGPLILTRNGKPLAAIKDLSGTDWESVALANNPKFLSLIEESRRSFEKHGGIELETLREELGLKTTRPRGRRKTR